MATWLTGSGASHAAAGRLWCLLVHQDGEGRNTVERKLVPLTSHRILAVSTGYHIASQVIRGTEASIRTLTPSRNQSTTPIRT